MEIYKRIKRAQRAQKTMTKMKTLVLSVKMTKKESICA